uniref:Uncharacterized protein n=1 Tax=Chromera velia CCMP2878 TaxID=1169474 RepID=A0A0G4GLC6_9ALVE|eukprot:Cvel_4863.t1-p1 / transcript=Cvel_4863.t1 / gene=Cvel_4863 / organism=Chromera_velia_CCMP2878 / gene_product=Ankyrin repeat domain-containing protein 29, putative / transcript_product=Ankyrin repeat domain-containing protein 29, putative / location=Cvel_scaffold219:68108-71008(+) / protein_length=594 / sequence_SO=supercontig / SO=protein_coding / is_pseudo=false
MSRFHMPDQPDEFEIRCHQLHEQMRAIIEREALAAANSAAESETDATQSNTCNTTVGGPVSLEVPSHSEASSPVKKSCENGPQASVLGSVASTRSCTRGYSSPSSALCSSSVPPSVELPETPKASAARPPVPMLVLPGVISKESGRRPYADAPPVRHVPERDMIRAAEMGDAQTVRTAVFSGTNPNAKDATGSTALHYAAKGGHKETVQLLLQHRANVKLVNRDGRTALHLACLPGFEEIVEWLLQAGADANGKTKFGSAGLHWAAARGHTAVVRSLLTHGAAVDLPNENDATALLSAAFCGHLEVVRILLAHGARLTATNAKEMTALHLAASRKHGAVVEEIINAYEASKGLIVEGQTGHILDTTDKVGDTALHKAASSGCDRSALALLAAGAKTSIRNNAGALPLDIARTLDEQKVGEVLEDHTAALAAGAVPKDPVAKPAGASASASTLTFGSSPSYVGGAGNNKAREVPAAKVGQSNASSWETSDGATTWVEIQSIAGGLSEMGGADEWTAPASRKAPVVPDLPVSSGGKGRASSSSRGSRETALHRAASSSSSSQSEERRFGGVRGGLLGLTLALLPGASRTVAAASSS